MPLPAGVDGVTVSSGKPLTLPDGTPIEGKLLFSGPDVAIVAGQEVFLGGTTEAKLVNGAFSVTLAANDVAGMSPSGWTYRVTAAFTNAPGWVRYISLPKASPAVVLASVIVPDPAAGTYTVLADPSSLLAKTANLSDVADVPTARGNLGLGTAATRNVGSASGTVAAGDDTRLSDSRTPTAHATTHASGGSDPVSPASIGAVANQGDEIVYGEKTFADRIPVGPGFDPAFDNQLTRKGYTDATYAPKASLPDQPSDQNLLAWTYDPNMAGHVTAQSSGGVAGRISLSRLILRKQVTWSNIWLGLSGIDAGASLANCYLGVYDSTGTLKGSTADISSLLMTNPVAKPFALAAPFTAPAGTYFIAMLLNGTWTTNSLTFKCSGAGVSANAGLSAPNLRYSSVLTGQTSLPASVNLATQSTTIISTGWDSQWYGVS